VANIIGAGAGLGFSVILPSLVRPLCLIITLINLMTNLTLFYTVPHEQMAERPAKEPLIPAIRSFLTNKPFRIIFIVFAVIGISGSLAIGVQNYFFQQLFHVTFATVQQAILVGGGVFGPFLFLANVITPR